jgi:transcription initiation factor TFIID subunit 13
MYAFGDQKSVAVESVNVLEEILVDYISEVVRASPSARLRRPAEAISQCIDAHKVSTNKAKIKLDDLRFALRHPYQRKQLARVDELHARQAEITAARATTGMGELLDPKAMRKAAGLAGRGGRGRGRGRGRARGGAAN